MNRVVELSEVSIVVGDDRAAGRIVLDAWVLAVSGSTVALEPVAPEQSARLPDTATEAFMTFEHGGHLIGLRGYVLVLDGGSELRFVVADDVQQPRRSATRVEIALPVTIGSAGAAPRAGTTIDLSMDGVLAAVDRGLGAGESVMVEIGLPGGETIAVGGVTVDAAGRAGGGRGDPVAVRFEHHPDANTRGRVAQVVIETNRARLRRAAAPAGSALPA